MLDTEDVLVRRRPRRGSAAAAEARRLARSDRFAAFFERKQKEGQEEKEKGAGAKTLEAEAAEVLAAKME